MPFVEEQDLLQLHKDLDKAETVNERLLDQIKFKNKELKKSKRMRNVFGLISAFFLVGSLVLVSFSFGVNSVVKDLKFNQPDTSNVLVSLDSLESYKERITELQEKTEEVSIIENFYLAKNFLEGKKIYSVQVTAFTENNVPLISNNLANSRFVKENPFYTYALGNFETLKEAQDFRFELVKMGFEDAFVASYKNGKRVEIEDPY
jgi:hypothetical protein